MILHAALAMAPPRTGEVLTIRFRGRRSGRRRQSSPHFFEHLKRKRTLSAFFYQPRNGSDLSTTFFGLDDPCSCAISASTAAMAFVRSRSLRNVTLSLPVQISVAPLRLAALSVARSASNSLTSARSGPGVPVPATMIDKAAAEVLADLDAHAVDFEADLALGLRSRHPRKKTVLKAVALRRVGDDVPGGIIRQARLNNKLRSSLNTFTSSTVIARMEDSSFSQLVSSSGWGQEIHAARTR